MSLRHLGLPVAAVVSGLLFSPLEAKSDESLHVVASVRPVHGLVAAIMDGTGEPDLLIDGISSPHGYVLKPSEMSAVTQADLVIWVGGIFETFLARPLENAADGAEILTLLDVPDLKQLTFREGSTFEAHDHGAEHDDEHHAEDEHEGHHDEHDDEHHAEDDHEDHHDEHDDEHHAEDGHEGDHHDHHAGAIDPHIWLDPHNAMAMAQAISAALIKLDPENAATYRQNTESLIQALTALDQSLTAQLAASDNRPFVVFHDAYRYFEERYGLQAVGAITVNPDTPPSADRLQEIQEKLRSLSAACVFSEPQFPDRLVSVAMEGSDARIGILDPLGTEQPSGPEHYFAMMRAMGRVFESCLSPTG